MVSIRTKSKESSSEDSTLTWVAMWRDDYALKTFATVEEADKWYAALPSRFVMGGFLYKKRHVKLYELR